jgi:hypothetical protein
MPNNLYYWPGVQIPEDGSSALTDMAFDQVNKKGQGIFCWVRIGAILVADGVPTSPNNNVISMKAEFVGSIQGGPNATCEIVLHNSHQAYGRYIADRTTWKPNLTDVLAIVYNYKNMVVGTESRLIRKGYYLFHGVIERASFDDSTCTIYCTSHDGIAQQAHFERHVFLPEDPPEYVIKEIMTEPLNKNGFPPVIVNQLKDIWHPIKIQIEVSERQSTIVNASNASNEYGFLIYCDPQIAGPQPRILLLNDSYVSGGLSLTEYVTKQGFTMSALGHANVVDTTVTSTVATSTDPTDPKQNVPVTQEVEVHVQRKDNTQSIAEYGEILYYELMNANMADKVNAGNKTLNTIATLDAKMDNQIEATVVGIIPKIYWQVYYVITDGIDGSNNIPILATVDKLTVNYSSKGLISQMVMTRVRELSSAGVVDPSEPPDDPVPVSEYPIYSKTYLAEAALGSPLRNAIQGRMNADGTIEYNQTGFVISPTIEIIRRELAGYLDVHWVTVWTSSITGIPAGILTDINTELNAKKAAM